MKTASLKVSLTSLREEPFASILCYPKSTKSELEKRVKELEKLGVTALEFCGKKQVSNLKVLGKGCVGIVVKAYRGGEAIALKIRRVDADRATMLHEAEMIRVANNVNVGPQFLGVSKNFLLMQFVEGFLFPEWLEKRPSRARLKIVLKDVLEQCWRLDKAGLDHGELSHAQKHIIVNSQEKPFILDFETASINRKPSNVTSVAQFLFISGTVAEKIAQKLGVKDKKTVIEALRRYKVEGNRQNFEALLSVCGIQAT